MKQKSKKKKKKKQHLFQTAIIQIENYMEFHEDSISYKHPLERPVSERYKKRRGGAFNFCRSWT